MNQQASILQRFEELKADFDRRDVFNGEVNAIRARTIAIAGAPEAKRTDKSLKTSSSEQRSVVMTKEMLAVSKPSHQINANTSSRRDRHSVAVSSDQSPSQHQLPSTTTTKSSMSRGMQALQQRLCEVEDAAVIAQAKGIPIDVELKVRSAQESQHKDHTAVSIITSSTRTKDKRSVTSSRNLAPSALRSVSNQSPITRQASSHVAGGGAGAVNQIRKLGPTPTGAASSEKGDDDLSRDGKKQSWNSPPRVEPRIPSPVERTAIAPSEWFQRSAEHLDYPEAEKQVRNHLKKRDDAHRGASNLVERYTVPYNATLTEKERLWNEGSAKVTVSLIPPDPLKALRKRSQASTSQLASSDVEDDIVKRVAANNAAKEQQRAVSPIQKRRREGKGDVPQVDEDPFERMQDRSHFLEMAKQTRRARKVYEDTISKELLAAANMLGTHLPLFANDPKKGRGGGVAAAQGDDDFLHRQHSSDDELAFSSSDDEEDRKENPKELAEREGIRIFSDDQAFQVPGVRPSTTDATSEDLLDTCELMECSVVCLCQQMTANQGSISREQAILRSILLHSLDSGRKPMDEELNRRVSFLNKTSNIPPAQSALDTAIVGRLLRSWTKGIEVILTLDLNTINDEGIPFTIHDEHHLHKLVQYYCTLHEAKDQRVQRLFERWRGNREEADSMIIKNDTQKLIIPKSTNEKKAAELLDHFKRVASVTSDDLALLDQDSAKLAGKQQDLAIEFLRRMSKFLPGSNHAQTSISEQREKEAELLTEDDLREHRSPPNLRHVLLHYAGLLRPGVKGGRGGGGGIRDASPSPVPTNVTMTTDAAVHDTTTSSSVSIAAGATTYQPSGSHVTPLGISKFLNVFRSTWGRTPLSGEVSVDEAADRATTIQNGTLILLLDGYFRLLSPLMQDRIKLMIREAKKRSEEIKAKMASDSEELRHALGAFGASAQDVREQQTAQEAKKALQEVERYQLIDKYTVSKMDPKLASKLKKSIESSEEWFSYENSRRAARLAVATSPEEYGTWHDGDNTAPGSGTTGTQEGGSGLGESSGGSPPKNSRMELIRIRKLQELEQCWHKLGLGYSLRVALHDKWNHPTKEIRNIDNALKLYRECLGVVEQREAALNAVLDNEKCENKAEKLAQRNALFATMCAAGQKCELVAKRLFNETGDELHYHGDVYLTKLRDDFARISQMLRMS